MTEFDNETNDGAGADRPRFSRTFAGPVIPMILILLLGVLTIMDYSSIIFSGKRKRAAQELIKPGMRLTQAERTLNSAGYMTLYIEASPPMLQVSTLNRFPLTAELLHKVLPHSVPDQWLRSRLSGKTRFYLAGEMDGAVRFRSEGRPVVFNEGNPAVGKVTSGF